MRGNFGRRLFVLVIAFTLMSAAVAPVAIASTPSAGATGAWLGRSAIAPGPGHAAGFAAFETTPSPVATVFQYFGCSQSFDTTMAMASGQLTDASGNPVVGVTIEIQATIDGSAWVTVAVSQTGVDGFFAEQVTVLRHTDFRAVYAGTESTMPAVSAIGIVPYWPGFTYEKEPPSSVRVGAKNPLRVFSTVAPHAGVPCVGVFRYVRSESGKMVTRKTVNVTGVYNAATGRMVYFTDTAVPYPGSWQVWFSIKADAVHDQNQGGYWPFTAGLTALSSSVSRTDVGVGGAVTISGQLTARPSGAGMSGRTVRLQWSTNNSSWSTVQAKKTGKSGKVSFTAHPKSLHYFRIYYPGSATTEKKASAGTLVQTHFTLKGSKAGHFTTKKVWLTEGSRGIEVLLDGSKQAVWIHSQGDVQKSLLAKGWGLFSGYLPVIRAGYAHFRITGSGYYRITVWN